MFQVLGKDTSLVKLGEDWKERMSELAGEGPQGEILKGLFDSAQFTYYYATEQDVHAFIFELPEDTPKEDVQTYTKAVQEIRSLTDYPMVTFKDQPQRCRLVITAEKEPELIGRDKSEGFSSGALFQDIFDSWSKEKNIF